MTQEEKAKRYDEIVKKVNKMHHENCDACKACVEELIPELAESEDEKIRKAIIIYLDWLDGRKDYAPKEEFSIRDMIAWIEKQGEKPKKVSIWKHWKNGIAGNGDGELIYLIKYGHTYSLSSCLSFECDYIELSELDKLLFEKKGEQKPFDYENANIQQKDFAPKVEPKFKVGDWITNGESTWLIDAEAHSWRNACYNMYDLVSLDGHSKVYSTISHVDEHFHLWTIQDAKDGDVLTGSHGTFYFMGEGNGYWGVLNDNTFIDSTGNNEWTECLHPATKEQRDLLFQKIKDAGYEWDDDKKGLRKIEQKPVEWSEEDEEMFQALVCGIGNYTYFCGIQSEDIVNWLKSLKQNSRRNNYGNKIQRVIMGF